MSGRQVPYITGSSEANALGWNLVCAWTLDEPDEGKWDTSCGESFLLLEGTPEDNNMRFCCYCGLPLTGIVGIE